LACCVVGLVAVTAQAGQGPAPVAGPAGGLVVARGEAGGLAQSVVGVAQAKQGKSRVKLLAYHNGPVVTQGAAVTAIFWGSNWSNTSFAGDKISGLDTLYGGLGGTPYAGSNIEYTQSGGQHVSAAVTYGGHVFDGSTTSPGAPSTSAVLAVVARKITNPVPNGYYPVYSDQPRGNAGYCAWHSSGTIGSVPVTFAFFFKLDGDAGCDPGDGGTVHSQGLEALANVSGHEYSEMVTDPQLNAWYDSSGAENSDKCAWTFGPSVTLGGQSWKIQGNWSNAAYGTGRSYLGSGSGCIETG